MKTQVKVLHIMYGDKFTRPLTKWLDEHLYHASQQSFLMIDEQNPTFNQVKLANGSNLYYLELPLRSKLIKNFIQVYRLTHDADKIVLHGLPLLAYFFVFSKLLKKTAWVIYGGADMYLDNNAKWSNTIKKKVLKKLSGHLTHIKGDSDWCNLFYQSNARFFDTPIYLSNTVKFNSEQVISTVNGGKIGILLGNSTDPSNNHMEIMEWLKPYAGKIKIYCPLSYGNYATYKAKVIQEGKRIFGEDFIAVEQFMDIDTYKQFLTEHIQTAIFNHKRQEAMGVTLLLISLGKKVFVYPNTTSFVALKNKNIPVCDNSLLKTNNISLLLAEPTKVPYDALDLHYSEEALLKSWSAYYAA